MVDYNAALPQLQQFQAPNMLAMAEMANKMQLHQAQLAEVQRATNEQNQMRALFASGVDRGSPEALRQAYNISMAAGQALEKGQNELKTAGLTQQKLTGDIAAQTPALQKAQTENMAADHKLYSEMLNKILQLDDARAAPAYEMLRAGAVSKYKDIDMAWPRTFERDVLKGQMLTAEQAAQAQAAKLADERKALQPSVHDFGGTPYSVVGTTAQPITVGGAAPAAPSTAIPAGAAAAGVQPFAAPANTPAAVMRQPVAAPAVGDAQAMRTAQIEGTGKNPMSSAQGLHQFIDSTFVGTAKKVFPELANKSPTEILALRGTKLADGTPIESALEQKFRADNIASLASAGIQPTPGNTYLAHFLGAGGARSVLGADPNTPVASLLDPRAIAANKSVLEGKTAGEVAAWAANKFGNQPGLAASMTAGNARLGGAPAGFVPAGGTPMSLGAPTVNNALMANMMAGQAAPTNMLASPAAPQIAAPAAQTPIGPTPGAPISTVKQTLTPVEEQKAREDIGKAHAEVNSSLTTLKYTMKAVQDLIDTPDADKERILGKFGANVANLTDAAKDAQTKFNDVKGQVTAMAKAGAGAIGSMAKDEWAILANQVSSLDPANMTPTILNRQLKTIMDRASELAKNTHSNYTATYGPMMDKYKGQFDMPAVEPPKLKEIDATAKIVKKPTINGRPPLSSFGGG
jgi:hypothetical protein